MNVLSLFDGMSCGQIALNRIGVKVDNYFASEIKPYAIETTQINYPDTIQLGSVTDLTDIDLILPKLDVVIGGSLCQDFSGANRERLGVDGPKSKLFWEYVRVLEEAKTVNPNVKFLLENVKMKKEHQDFVSGVLGCEPIVINSELVSPHLRHRLYWTNIEVSGLPENKNLELNSFLISGYSDRKKARTLLVSDSRPLSTPVKMLHRYFNKGFTTLIFKSKEHYQEVKNHFDLNFKGLTAKEIDRFSKDMDLTLYDGIRYMLKSEREACQTVPIGYTNKLTENEAADLLGDGWTVDVIAHIFKNIKHEK